MKLVPFPQACPNQTIEEYETVWFNETGTCSMFEADYGIEVWFNEANDGLWHAAKILIVDLFSADCFDCPPVSGNGLEEVVRLAKAMPMPNNY